jgi:hypothetical protein
MKHESPERVEVAGTVARSPKAGFKRLWIVFARGDGTPRTPPLTARSLPITLSLVGFFLDGLLELVLGLAGWGVLLPLFWLVATPFILVIAPFRRERFWVTVPRMYGGVTEFWKECDLFWW